MLCGNYILSNRSEWTFYFLSSVQFNFTIGDAIVLVNTAISWIEYAVAAKFELVENKHGHSLTRKIKNSLMISINTVKKIQKRRIL